MVYNCPPRMETTFYEDQSFNRGDVHQMKKNMTLDFNSRGQLKRQKFNPILSSPDLNMLKLGSPELEKLIIQQNGLVTTTPTPTQILFPRMVTEEQEQYARGFVDALNNLHYSDSSQMSNGLQEVDVSSVPVTSTSITYTTLEPQGTGTNLPAVSTANLPVSTIPTTQSVGFPPVTSCAPVSSATSTYALPPSVTVKDEPQTVPNLGSTPPLSPIDMECQERIKLERKRQRNRIAASKCRRRKLERIAKLEDKVKLLKGENTELSTVVNKLKEEVCQLKEQVMDHVHSGCQIMVTTHF